MMLSSFRSLPASLVACAGLSHGYPAAWVKTLNTIATLDFDRIVPGHGRIREGKDHLRLVTEMFESIVAQVNAAIGRKLSLEDTRKSVDLTRFRETLAVDARAGRTFDAWMPETIERAYLEATGKLNTEQDR